MNIITKSMYSIHRILGTLLCILFLMWFLSAFVMMYHHFPRVNANEKLQKQETLSTPDDSLPDIASVMARLPHKEKVRNLTLGRNLGQTVFHIRTNKGEYDLPLNPSDSMPQVDNERIRRTAALWCSAPIARIDTIHSLDQWIPFGKLKKEMPIYKIHFADDAQTQLYLSSQKGEAIQFSNRNERFWAWMGAIPHWVYFTRLRQDAALWNKTVIWLSGLGCIMVIAGIWITIDIWCKTRRSRHHRFSPYRKKWYHWHYMTGIIFGIFVLTFTFSGMMSLADIPEWIHKPALKNNPVRTLHAHAPQPDQYTLDYRSVIAAHPQALQIEWSNFREHPYYTVKDGKTEFYIDAADSLPRPLQLSEDEIRRGIESIYASDSATAHHPVPIRMSLLSHFETYYRDMSSMYRGRPQLPVWKVTVEDADRSVYYIHPETGNIRHVDTSSRWKYWSYTALHRMRLPGLNSNATLRKTVLWALLLGGTVVSVSSLTLNPLAILCCFCHRPCVKPVTGLALSINYLRRICRRKRR